MKLTTILGLAMLGTVLALIACTAPSATSTPTARPTAVPPTDTPVPAPAGPTASELAQLGQAAHSASCAGCHGQQGEGARAPALVGEGFAASSYANAQALLEKIRDTMPRGNPGSLSDEEYLQITVWLLLKNEFVEGDAIIEAAQLTSTALSK